jgi:hypothetical protein
VREYEEQPERAMLLTVLGLRRAPLVVVALLSARGPGEVLDRQHGDWRARAAPLVYQGTELYTYMDGGAEIYIEYGFERLESQSYERGADEIAVELYRLRDDAFGLLTFLRSPRCETPSLGDVACLAGHYLLFAKGPYLCAVTAQAQFQGSREALLKVGGAIAARLEGAGQSPEVLRLLPAEGRLEATEKQIRGPVGLRSVSQQAGELFGGFRDGACATFDPEVTGCVLVWADASLAEVAWRGALRRSRRDDARSGPGAPQVLSWCDGPRCFGAERSGASVVFAEAGGLPQVSEWMARLEAGVAGDQTRPGKEQ